MHVKHLLSPRALARCALLALPVAASASAAPATLASGAYPPPGLYRVDTDGSLQRNRGALPAIVQQLMQDGASGSGRMSGGRANEAPVTRNYPGMGPANYCMPALPANGAAPVRAGCKSGAPVAGPGSVSYLMQCGGLKTNTTIRKIDAKTWEYKVVSSESGAPASGQPDYAGARGVLAAQAKNGATAAERAEAAQLLAQMGAYEAEMKSKAAELADARAEMAGGAGGTAMTASGNALKERTSILRLTRIADTCGAAGK